MTVRLLLPTLTLTLTLSLSLATTPAAAGPAPISGAWKTDDGAAIVNIAPCGNGTHCGTIARFLRAEPAGGIRDAKNPDPKLRNRRVLGTAVLWNLRPKGGAWSGSGYSARDGRKFNATVSSDGSKLNLKGCVLVVCRTVVWTRAS